jgi:hypothetical protein
VAIENPALDITYNEFVWCQHCERVGRVKDWVANRWTCPLDNCDGNAIDAWSWEDLREKKPELPETPENGASYPLYDQ